MVRQVTFLPNAEYSGRDRERAVDRAMHIDEGKHLRDPEDRVIDECSPEQLKDKEMDKTLADSFPASDPPAWQPE